MNTLVNVLVELDDGSKQLCLARIEKDHDTFYDVRYLSQTKKRIGDKYIYKYEKDVYTIDKDCVDEYYDSPFEEDAGFSATVKGGWVLADSDSDDYTPSDSEESETESESFTESEED